MLRRRKNDRIKTNETKQNKRNKTTIRNEPAKQNENKQNYKTERRGRGIDQGGRRNSKNKQGGGRLIKG